MFILFLFIFFLRRSPSICPNKKAPKASLLLGLGLAIEMLTLPK